ncbi:packaged DNA stabilization gp4 family protein [Xanthomonas sp. NCPPB 3005]|uniref:packaged DNA stabilization gp4 family protein n=1 Tax=Xanthomonas sp. NCPPB 3005 TaxID=3240913 RepID=UPI0035111429
MTSVATVVTDALQLLRVVDANEAPEAEDMATGIRALNMMMRVWEVEGPALGWSDVAAPGDTLPAPPEAEEAITDNLALRLRARYGAALEPDVLTRAREGLSMLRSQALTNSYARLSYPDLPEGQGCPGGTWRDGYNC